MGKRKPYTYTVDPLSGCWNWNGPKDHLGYGVLRLLGERKKAHRWVYEQYHGAIVGGLPLDHLCRNTGCVNPCHLQPVETHVNTQRGLSAKLTLPIVERIRQEYASGASQKSLSKLFNVSRAAIGLAVTGATWENALGPIASSYRDRLGSNRRRLSVDDVLAIRKAAVRDGNSYRILAERFSVSQQHIGRIASGKARKQMTDVHANRGNQATEVGTANGCEG